MKRCLLLLVSGGMLILSACKKDSTNQTSTALVPSADPSVASFSVPLTSQELATLNSLMAEGKIQSPDDFSQAVSSLKAADAGKNIGNASVRKVKTMDANDYNPSQDNQSSAISTSPYTGTLAGMLFNPTRQNVNSSFQTNLSFPIRGNTVQVVIPYQYYWAIDPVTGTNIIANVRASTPIQLLPVGAYWGEVTQGTTNYINGSSGTSSRSAAINAYANAQEKRTEIFSVQGGTKLSTNLDLEVFKIGTELSANFTVQSTAYTYNQYTMTANGQIYIGTGGTFWDTKPPSTSFMGTITCVDLGILKNQ